MSTKQTDRKLCPVAMQREKNRGLFSNIFFQTQTRSFPHEMATVQTACRMLQSNASHLYELPTLRYLFRGHRHNSGLCLLLLCH